MEAITEPTNIMIPSESTNSSPSQNRNDNDRWLGYCSLTVISILTLLSLIRSCLTLYACNFLTISIMDVEDMFLLSTPTSADTTSTIIDEVPYHDDHNHGGGGTIKSIVDLYTQSSIHQFLYDNGLEDISPPYELHLGLFRYTLTNYDTSFDFFYANYSTCREYDKRLLVNKFQNYKEEEEDDDGSAFSISSGAFAILSPFIAFAGYMLSLLELYKRCYGNHRFLRCGMYFIAFLFQSLTFLIFQEQDFCETEMAVDCKVSVGGSIAIFSSILYLVTSSCVFWLPQPDPLPYFYKVIKNKSDIVFEFEPVLLDCCEANIDERLGGGGGGEKDTDRTFETMDDSDEMEDIHIMTSMAIPLDSDRNRDIRQEMDDDLQYKNDQSNAKEASDSDGATEQGGTSPNKEGPTIVAALILQKNHVGNDEESCHRPCIFDSSDIVSLKSTQSGNDDDDDDDLSLVLNYEQMDKETEEEVDDDIKNDLINKKNDLAVRIVKNDSETTSAAVAAMLRNVSGVSDQREHGQNPVGDRDSDKESVSTNEQVDDLFLNQMTERESEGLVPVSITSIFSEQGVADKASVVADLHFDWMATRNGKTIEVSKIDTETITGFQEDVAVMPSTVSDEPCRRKDGGCEAVSSEGDEDVVAEIATLLVDGKDESWNPVRDSTNDEEGETRGTISASRGLGNGQDAEAKSGSSGEAALSLTEYSGVSCQREEDVKEGCKVFTSRVSEEIEFEKKSADGSVADREIEEESENPTPDTATSTDFDANSLNTISEPEDGINGAETDKTLHGDVNELIKEKTVVAVVDSDGRVTSPADETARDTAEIKVIDEGQGAVIPKPATNTMKCPPVLVDSSDDEEEEC